MNKIQVRFAYRILINKNKIYNKFQQLGGIKKGILILSVKIASYNHINMKTKKIIKKKYQKRQTKNLVLNYRTFFRSLLVTLLTNIKDVDQVLYQKLYKIYLSLFKANIKALRESLMDEYFNLNMKQYAQNGSFLSELLKSQMYIQNKLLCIRYFNIILNAIRKPQHFKLWKLFEINNEEVNIDYIQKNNKQTTKLYIIRKRISKQ